MILDNKDISKWADVYHHGKHVEMYFDWGKDWYGEDPDDEGEGSEADRVRKLITGPMLNSLQMSPRKELTLMLRRYTISQISYVLTHASFDVLKITDPSELKVRV